MKLNSIRGFVLIVLLWTAIAILLTPAVAEKFHNLISAQTVYTASANTGYSLSKIEFKTKDSTVKLTEEEEKTSYVFGSDYEVLEGRAAAMRRFLRDQNSPMTPYAELIVSEADKYGLDWRIVVGISGIESQFGKVIPAGSYNAWGWRGGPGGDWSRFDGWEHGIKHITRRLSLGYGIHLTPYDIESTYCPPCGATGQHYWARAVTVYMSHMKTYLENNTDRGYNN